MILKELYAKFEYYLILYINAINLLLYNFLEKIFSVDYNALINSIIL